MNAQQVVIIAVSISVALVVLLGALATRRALARAGRGLTAASGRLEERALTIPGQLNGARLQLAEVDARLEHMLWQLGNADDRIDRARSDLRASRVASDRLRVRLIEGRLTIARLKQLMRLLIRLGELRRVVL